MFSLKSSKPLLTSHFSQNGGEEERVEEREGKRTGRANEQGMRQTDGKKKELNRNLGTNPMEQGE